MNSIILVNKKNLVYLFFLEKHFAINFNPQWIPNNSFTNSNFYSKKKPYLFLQKYLHRINSEKFQF